MFDYLMSHDGPVVDGLEKFETVYAKDQPQYRPLRTLPGENGNSAISRFHLTDEQRKAIAEGADIYLEIVHFKGPLAPSRLMVMSDRKSDETHFFRWFRAQTKGTYPVPEPVATEKTSVSLKFTKKPVVIEAMQYKGTIDSYLEICKWMGDVSRTVAMFNRGDKGAFELRTLETANDEQLLTVSKDDWVIRGLKGEFYPCKPDIFKLTYDVAE